MKKESSISGRFIRYFLVGFSLLCLLQSCNESSEPVPDRNRNYPINLFPNNGSTANNKTDSLSFEEAFAQSALVLHVPYLRKIDSSNEYGAPVFYIYQAPKGKVEKALKISNPSEKDTIVSFLSEKKLFEGKSINDSVYLFLEPLDGYKLLRNSMKLNYHWVTNAQLAD